jgi:hypothetical protein
VTIGLNKGCQNKNVYRCSDCLRRKNRAYKKANKDKVLRDKNNYYKNRISDPSFKILCRLRRRMYDALKGNIKTEKSLELIGCDPEDLKEYIENQFQQGMTWDNYGIKGWHLDHIIPCASFDFSSEDDQKKCFHYSNLQPLWWFDNIEKSDQLDWSN